MPQGTLVITEQSPEDAAHERALLARLAVEIQILEIEHWAITNESVDGLLSEPIEPRFNTEEWRQMMREKMRKRLEEATDD